uniref:Progestin and adipoQ receptor family member 4 n=1 Tax=Cairina moschata TaxID=8855 RepID=A0A8C3GGM5_CAIMO
MPKGIGPSAMTGARPAGSCNPPLLAPAAILPPPLPPHPPPPFSGRSLPQAPPPPQPFSPLPPPGAVPIIYCWLPCQPWRRGAALALYAALSLLALRGAVRAASSARRLGSFAGPALFRLLVLGLRAAGLGGGAPGALSCYGRMDALALLGGAVNAARVPERWSPGRFDYWGNSHQLMHLLVVLGLLHLHWGVAQDLQWVVQNPCPGQ